jgi:hypothetical protein
VSDRRFFASVFPGMAPVVAKQIDLLPERLCDNNSLGMLIDKWPKRLNDCVNGFLR